MRDLSSFVRRFANAIRRMDRVIDLGFRRDAFNSRRFAACALPARERPNNTPTQRFLPRLIFTIAVGPWIPRVYFGAAEFHPRGAHIS